MQFRGGRVLIVQSRLGFELVSKNLGLFLLVVSQRSILLLGVVGRFVERVVGGILMVKKVGLLLKFEVIYIRLIFGCFFNSGT
jgi:hypothetical protein